MAFQSGAFQSSAFQGGAVTPGRRPQFAGGRSWYLFKDQRLFLTKQELAYLLAQEERLQRESLKIKRKVRHRTVSRAEWEQIMQAVASINVGLDEPIAVVDPYDDEEAAIEVLLAFIH